jgi:hypothetical protein
VEQSTLKRKLLNDVRSKINILKNGFMKKCKNKDDFTSIHDYESLEKKINSSYREELKKFKFLTKSHYFEFYMISRYPFGLSVDFPEDFKSKEELNENTIIKIKFSNAREDKIKKLNYYEFVSFINNYRAFYKFYEDKGIFKHPNLSERSIRLDLFTLAFENELSELEGFTTFLERNNQELELINHYRKQFLESKAKNNKIKKKAKKNKSYKNDSTYNNNIKKIEEYKREINRLIQENKRIEEGTNSVPVLDVVYNKERENQYQGSVEKFLLENKRYLYKTKFKKHLDLIFNA